MQRESENLYFRTSFTFEPILLHLKTHRQSIGRPEPVPNPLSFQVDEVTCNPGLDPPKTWDGTHPATCLSYQLGGRVPDGLASCHPHGETRPRVTPRRQLRRKSSGIGRGGPAHVIRRPGTAIDSHHGERRTAILRRRCRSPLKMCFASCGAPDFGGKISLIRVRSAWPVLCCARRSFSRRPLR